MKPHDERLFESWKKRWKDCSGEEKLTVLGKAMFKDKRKVLIRVASGLGVKEVLEAGCGLGETMAVYRELGMDVLGVDISEDAVRLCREKGFDARCMPMQELEQSFELVSSDGMLEHFLNFEPQAREFMRLSSRYVLIIQPNYNSASGQTLAWLANLLRGHVNVYEYNYRLEDFIQVFEDNGFSLRQSEPVFCDVFRILVFERGQA